MCILANAMAFVELEGEIIMRDPGRRSPVLESRYAEN